MSTRRADEKQFIRMVSTQIQQNSPAFVADAFDALRGKGMREKTALHKIACSCRDILRLMEEGMNVDLVYCQQLNYLIHDSDLMSRTNILNMAEYCEQCRGWMNSSLLMHLCRIIFTEDEKVVSSLAAEWPYVRDYINAHFRIPVDEGETIRPVYDPSSAANTEYNEICSVLEEAGFHCINTRHPEETIALMKDIVDTFRFHEESVYLYDILELFTRADMYEERDAWYKTWHEQLPDSQNLVNSYACALLEQKPQDYKKTDALLQEIAEHPDGWDCSWEYMLELASDFYYDHHEIEKSDFFRNLHKNTSYI